MRDSLGFDDAFYVLLADAASTGGFEAEDLLAVFASASGLDPMFYEPVGPRLGLAALSPAVIYLSGGNSETFRFLPAQEQLILITDYMRLLAKRMDLHLWTTRGIMLLALNLPALLPLRTIPDSVVNARGIRITLNDFETDISRACGSERYIIALERLKQCAIYK